MSEQYEEPIPFVASDVSIVKIGDLVKHKGNAKKHSEEQIVRLMGAVREFGFTVPLLIDGEKNIIAGHGRLEAADRLNMQELPCVVADHLSKAQRSALVLFDNKIAEGGWDDELLKAEIANLIDIDAEMIGMTGFTQAEISALIAGIDEPEPDEKEIALRFLKFGDYKIEISHAEEMTLGGLADVHINKHGTTHGFVSETLLGQNAQGQPARK